jgi:hypothetical protein
MFHSKKTQKNVYFGQAIELTLKVLTMGRNPYKSKYELRSALDKWSLRMGAALPRLFAAHQ